MEISEYYETNNRQDNDSYSTLDVSTKLNMVVERILDGEKFIKCKINKKLITENINFFGTLYEIDVEGRTKDEEKEIHLFVKCILHMDTYPVYEMYKTELFTYTDLFDQFEKLQIEANVDAQNIYKMVKMYKESNAEMIVMENISKKGFTTIPRTEVGTLDFFKMSVKELAKFHGLSFVIRETRPEYFKEKIKHLKYLLINNSFESRIMYTREATFEVVDEKFKPEIEKAFILLMNKIGQYYDDETIKVCLCHGDYRPCNIMVKSTDDGIQESIIIDFQMVHYGSPVFDFLYLMFNGTDREFRKAHMSTLKDLYYESLSNFLKLFRLDVEDVYPREEYEKVFREKLDFGLMAATYILPFILTSGDSVSDLTQEDMKLNYDSKFKDRLQEVIEEYMEWGLL